MNFFVTFDNSNKHKDTECGCNNSISELLTHNNIQKQLRHKYANLHHTYTCFNKQQKTVRFKLVEETL